MLKYENVINDPKFKENCKQFGLCDNDFEIFEDVIIVKSPYENLYVVFDKNFNIINVVNKDTENENLSGNSLFSSIPLGTNFNRLNTNQIISLSSRINASCDNEGRIVRINLAGKWYEKDKEDDKYIVQLLSYIKFLGEQINQYFLMKYTLGVMGNRNIIDRDMYIQVFTIRISDFIDMCIKKNQLPTPSLLLKYLGQSNDNQKKNGILSEIIEFLIEDKGYKYIKEEDKFKRIVTTVNKEKLDELYDYLQETSELSNEDIRKKDLGTNVDLLNRYISNVEDGIKKKVKVK